MQTENHARTLAKTVEISLIGTAFGMVTYYLHERFWNGVRWGRVEK